jgi:predicted metal-dependent HD superfamily phosphohydrolase
MAAEKKSLPPSLPLSSAPLTRHALVERLCAKLGWGEEEERTVRLVRMVEEKYGEAHRAYHNLSHLESIFSVEKEVFGDAEGVWEDEVAFVAAVAFHDIVYDVRRGDNEELSCAMMVDVLGSALPTSSLALACAMVLRTKSHHGDTPIDFMRGEDRIDLRSASESDVQRFIDLDLSIIGSSAASYAAYAAAIRDEYAHVPRAAYLEGRSRVLEKLGSGAHVFSTDTMRSARERPARENLAWEQSLLAAGRIPGE